MPLVFVPTPLGNLRDITLRALDALRDCELLVAEDSRVARKLFAALGLPAKNVWTYHEHNAASATAGILERARTRLVAVTTDAGTPGISDPGANLAAAARQADVPIEVLPGASALIGAIVLSGFVSRRFCFEGFAPRTSAARRTAFAHARAAQMPSIWYESPQRIRAALRDLNALDPNARVFLLREYTKLHEQQLIGTPSSVAAALSDPVRGEVVLVLDAASVSPAQLPDAAFVDAAIDELLAAATPIAAIAKTLVNRGFGSRSALYARAIERKRLQRGHPKPRR